MQDFCSIAEVEELIYREADQIACALNLQEHHPSDQYLRRGPHEAPWPLPNVWLGVSVEDQKTANERIPALLETPAAIRFISAEPLIGPLDLSYIDIDAESMVTPLQGHTAEELTEMWGEHKYDDAHALDWVIVGGESGPGARPIHPDWVRTIRDQCKEADVPFFFKQWGEFKPSFPQYPEEYGLDYEDVDPMCSGREFPAEGVLYRDGYYYDGIEFQPHTNSGCWWIERVGKKAAGRMLDGREHNAMPEVQ